MAFSVLLLGLLGCAETTQETLDARDEPLLGTMRELAEIRILAQEHPDSAQTRLEEFLAETDTTGLAQSLEELWKDPQRGRVFMQALHDSLKAPLEAGGGGHGASSEDEGI